jgi:hypothetical protein
MMAMIVQGTSGEFGLCERDRPRDLRSGCFGRMVNNLSACVFTDSYSL